MERVLVISKRSAYDNYVRRHRMARVRALLRANDPVVARLERADKHHTETLDELRATLHRLGIRARFRDRSQVGRVDGFDLVITVGGDGTVLTASHVVGDTPVFGINSAPLDSVGYLCGARRGNVEARVRAALEGTLRTVRVERMSVQVDGVVVHQRVVNDVLFAHRNPAMTSRYFLSFRGTSEEHKSSGVWIGPAAGSTAALASAGGKRLPPRSKQLQFVVREPYEPEGTKYRWIRSLVRPGEPLELWNKMREAMLFIDGPRNAIALEIGQHVAFDLSPEPLFLIGLGARDRR